MTSAADTVPQLEVVVADDHPWVREDFVALLTAEPDITVVGQAADGREAVELADELRPDVLLMDIRMPRLDGLSALREINRRLAPRPPATLMVTTFELDEYVFGALRESAAGFLLKDHAAKDLPSAVRAVACGDAMVSPSVTRRLISEFAVPTPGSAAAGLITGLTEREEQVLRLLAEGATNTQVTSELVISPATVKSHIRNILGKLGVETRTQAVIFAYESGLVRPGPKQHRHSDDDPARRRCKS
jgi:DNA-binding NarL/FixJ family response regulator